MFGDGSCLSCEYFCYFYPHLEIFLFLTTGEDFSTIFCFFETFFFFSFFSNHSSLVSIQILFFLFQNALICKKATTQEFLFLNSLRKHRKKFKNSQFSLKIFFFFLLSPRFFLDWFVFALDIPSRLDDRLKSAINNTRKYSSRCADQWAETFFFFRVILRSSTQHRIKVTREMNKKEEKCLKKALKINGNFNSLPASARTTPYDSNFCFRDVYCLTTEAQLIGEGKSVCDRVWKYNQSLDDIEERKNNKIESKDTSKWFYKPRIKSRYFYVYYFYRRLRLISTPARKISFDILSRLLIGNSNHKHYFDEEKGETLKIVCRHSANERRLSRYKSMKLIYNQPAVLR